MDEKKEFKQRYQYGLDHKPKSRFGLLIFVMIFFVVILAASLFYFFFFSADFETLLPNKVEFENNVMIANVEDSFIELDKINIYFKYNGVKLVQIQGQKSILTLYNLNNSCESEKIINLRSLDEGNAIILFRNNDNGVMVFDCDNNFENKSMVSGNLIVEIKDPVTEIEDMSLGNFRMKVD